MKVINNVGDVHSALRECTIDERLGVLQFLLSGAQLYTMIDDTDSGIMTAVYDEIDYSGIYMTGLQVTIPYRMDYQEIKNGIEYREDE